MTAPYRWTGTLKPGAEPGTVAVELVDTMGFTIRLTGTKVAGGYELVGVPGANPECWTLPGDSLFVGDVT